MPAFLIEGGLLIAIASIVLAQAHDRRMAEHARVVAALTDVVSAFMRYQRAMQHAFMAAGPLSVGRDHGPAAMARDAADDSLREMEAVVARWSVLRGYGNKVSSIAVEAQCAFEMALSAQANFYDRDSRDIRRDLDDGIKPPRFPNRFGGEITEAAYREARTWRGRVVAIFRRSLSALWRRVRYGPDPAAKYANSDEFVAAVIDGEEQ